MCTVFWFLDKMNLYLSCVVNEQINVPMVYLKMYPSLGVMKGYTFIPCLGCITSPVIDTR